MPYIGESVHLVGYRVRIERCDAFRVRGYTRIVPPGQAGEGAIPTFWRDVAADGRLARLVGASDWMCFEIARRELVGRFWQDNPYRMMKQLGCRFHAGDPSVGRHFDAFPPDYHPETNPACESWITVTASLRRRRADRS